MKKIIGILAVLGLSFACQQVELPVEQEHVSGPEFTAQAETFGAQTKTAMDGNSVVWNAGDQIAIFQGLSTADEYQVKDDGIGKTSATFEIVAKGNGSNATDLPANVAIYPYESGLTCTPVIAESGAVASYQIAGVTIPSTQTYTTGSFADESFPMAALTNGLNDHTLNFKNLFGVLKLQLKGTAKIKSIELKGNDNEPLSGEATVTVYPDGTKPTITMSQDASKTIILDCGDGVQLNETTATDFLIAIPPAAFDKGFSILVNDTNGGVDGISTDKSNSVRRSYVHKMPEVSVRTIAPAMTLVVKGNDMYVRAKDFSEDNDFVWRLQKVYTSNNRFFNIQGMYTCPSVVEDNATSGNLTRWKTSSDDICPILVNGSHIGGNHGHNCVDKLTVTDHGKTIADIGSIWSDANGKNYVLVYVYDKNRLGFVYYNDTTMSNGRMVYGNPAVGTEMIHVSGATNTDTILIEAREGTQLWKCSNKEVLKLYVDGMERDLSADCTYSADKIEVLTEYNVIYIPAMLNYLIANVGSNTAESQHSEDIEDSYFRVSVRYEFNKNGSVSQYNTYNINKTLLLSYSGLVQSMALTSAPYIYSPDTTYDVLTLHDNEVSHYLYKKTWRSADKVPYRFYQFADETTVKGMCLAYDRTYGWGRNEVRLNKIEYAGRYKGESKKMYPVFIGGGELEAGLSFDGLACRIPLCKYDEDLTAMGWYWLGDDIILMIDSHKVIDKDIILPDYMNDMKIEILDKTESVECTQTEMSDRKLRYAASDYGYLVVRLYYQ